MWWHTTAHICSLTLWEIQNLKSVSLGQGQGVASVVASRGSGGECFLLFLAPRGLLHSLAHGLFLVLLQPLASILTTPSPLWSKNSSCPSSGERYDLEVTVEGRILFPSSLG